MMRHDLSDKEREAVAILGGGCITMLICLLLLAVLALAVSCSAKREIVTHEVTKIETHDSICFVHDTLYFDVPLQTTQIVTHDSVSHLENDYAVSDVRINADGSLSHSLNTKQQSVPVPFEKPVETKTQVVYQDKRIEVPVPVEKQFTAWEQFRLRSFWALLTIAIVATCYVFRKPLLTLIRRFV